MKLILSLVGMQHRGTEALVASLPRGTDLVLVREPKNQHDYNAIQVWTTGERGGKHIAYVKSTDAANFAVYLDADGLTIPPFGDKSARWTEGRLTHLGRWPHVEVVT